MCTAGSTTRSTHTIQLTGTNRERIVKTNEEHHRESC